MDIHIFPSFTAIQSHHCLDADGLFQADVEFHGRVCVVDELVSRLNIDGDESSEPGRIVIVWNR